MQTSMKVNPNLKAVLPSPTNRLVKILQLAIHIRVIRKLVNSPVSDGNPNMIEASLTDLPKVVLGNEGIPVRSQPSPSSILAEPLSEHIFVENGEVERFEKTWSDPGLKNKPSAEINSTDLLVLIVERDSPLHEPRGTGGRASRD